MNLHPDGMASREPQTASERAEIKIKYAYTQNTALRTLDRKVLDKGLQTQWKFFSEDDVMFGSLSIRGGYVAHDMFTWRKDISSSSPKDILNLKQCLAEKALRFWELQKTPDPACIPGAKEEQAFVEAYENMVEIIQRVLTEEADKYSAYMEHRLRLATSTDGGKTLGPLLHKVLSKKVSNHGMRIAAVSPPEFSPVQMTQAESQELKFQAAQALHPERYAKLDTNHDLDVGYSRKKEGRNSNVVTAKSLVGRSLALRIGGRRLKTCDPVDTCISARTSGLGTTTFGTRASGLRTSRLRTFDTGSLTLEALNLAPFTIPRSLSRQIPQPRSLYSAIRTREEK
ncbi:hypothetical protein EAF00_002316 [Botryotinia globosa]|nr:hypothetical protein EAF00_002316 [Botryotinia globosa]